jgi:DNA mismatch repair protein MutS
MAGMPTSIVERATSILKNLEQVYGDNEIVPSVSPSARKKSRKPSPSVTVATQPAADAIQLSMFKIDDPVLIQIRDQIKGLDINSLTPLEALNLLSEIKKIAEV